MYLGLVAPEDGTYVFRIMPDNNSQRFKLIDYKGQDIPATERSFSYDDGYIATYEARKGERIIALFWTPFSGWCYGKFSICFGGYHKEFPIEYSEKTKMPTCTKEGVLSYPCVLCGSAIKTEHIPATGHTPGEWKVEKEPTCTEAGQSVQRCTVCNDVIATQEIPATGHDEGETVVTVEPTCIRKGQQVVQCTRCQAVLSSEELPMTGHTLGQMEVLAPATCLTEGRAEQRCTVCNALIAQESLPALGHVPGVWTETRAATCTADGERRQYCETCGGDALRGDRRGLRAQPGRVDGGVRAFLPAGGREGEGVQGLRRAGRA